MCAANDLKILCIIKDLTNPQWQQCKITVNLPATTTCKELCEEVARQANYEAGTFSLMWQRGGQDGGDDVSSDQGVLKLKSSSGLTPLNGFPILDCTKRRLKHGGFLGYKATGYFNSLISLKIMVLANLQGKKK